MDQVLTPAHDEATADDWSNRFGQEVERLRFNWNVTQRDHDDMLMARKAMGVPLYNVDWTEEEEKNYQRFASVAAYVINYFDEVDRRVRAVAYDPSIDNIVALGTVGEPKFSVDSEGTITVTIPGNNPVSVRRDGTVSGAGAPGWLVPVVVGVVSLSAAAAVYFICDTIQKRIKAAAENDTRRHVEELKARGLSADEIERVLEAENKQIENRNKDPLTEFLGTLKTLAIVGAVVGVVGAGVYFAYEYWPSRRVRASAAA